MSRLFAQISDPHLSSLEGVRPGDLLNKRALGYLSWRRKRRFEHRPEVLQPCSATWSSSTWISCWSPATSPTSACPGISTGAHLAAAAGRPQQ